MYIYTTPDTGVVLDKPHSDTVASLFLPKPSWLKLQPQHPRWEHTTYIKPTMRPFHRSVHMSLVAS